MAVGTTKDAGKAADTKADTAPATTEGQGSAAEPETLARKVNALPSLGALQHAVLMENATPDGDRVAMVSRDVNGHPMQSDNYVVLVDEDAPQVEKDAAHNLAGYRQGAQHVKAGE